MGSITIPGFLPSPIEDCEKLRKAFQGWGVDKKAIISILGHRTASQREKISQTYEELYQESLIDRLNSKISGDFGKAVILWTVDPPQRDAKLAREALRKKGVKHLAVIVEIACASSPAHLIAVRKAYCSLFRCSLEEDIALYVSQPLRKLLVSLVGSYRYEGEEGDGKVAKEESDKLHVSIENKHLEQEHVIWILSTRNKFQLQATFTCYKYDYSISVDEDIKDSINSDFASLLRMAVLCIHSPEKYFADVVRSSIVGLGTDEDSLTRAIVTRAEIDMMKIKEYYYEVNEVSIVDAVIDDTSGDYKDFLVTLLGHGTL
ncbi:annexin D3-like [Magnolia sinica]|uniref:annexin D3-like n=1 Tax=Magnolia sinica TaxID=86752 RepID=UPI0026592606|nr:annexin D3-like [Magnolia sinica]